MHVFIATSPIHMQYKLKMTPDQVVDQAVTAVKYLKSQGCHDIEFSPEDASRSEPDFLYRVLTEVIKAGATTLNIPDTTGWALPHEFAALITKIRGSTPGAENVIISTHCQNDLGLATANSLAGGHHTTSMHSHDPCKHAWPISMPDASIAVEHQEPTLPAPLGVWYRQQPSNWASACSCTYSWIADRNGCAVSVVSAVVEIGK